MAIFARNFQSKNLYANGIIRVADQSKADALGSEIDKFLTESGTDEATQTLSLIKAITFRIACEHPDDQSVLIEAYSELIPEMTKLFSEMVVRQRRKNHE